jgi:RNA recognition motif-containing protein
VFVGPKLPDYTNEQNIKEHFSNFAAHIVSIELIRDKHTKQFKGFGFIVFSSTAAADAAIRDLNRSTLLGVRIKVAKDKSSSGPAIAYPGKNQPPHPATTIVSVDNVDLSLGESEIGTIIKVPMLSFARCSPPSTKSIVVKLYSPADAQVAVRALNGKVMLGETFQAHILPGASSQPQEANPTDVVADTPGFISVKVTHLPPGITIEKMHAHFSEVGDIDGNPFLQITQKSVYGYVNYIDPRSAQKAVNHLHRSEIDGVSITVKPAKKQGSSIGPNADCSAHEKVTKLSSDQLNGISRAYLVDEGPQRPCGVAAGTPGSTSVKVTHLPPSITKEKMNAHFSVVGKINGDPNLQVTQKSVYGYVNYLDPHSAQRAVNELHCSEIDGVSITVKLAKNSGSTTKAPNADSGNHHHEKVMKLSSEQWNSLMLTSGETSLFKELTAPFKSNPNVTITPICEEMRVKFAGKFDAVESAYDILNKNMKKEIVFNRLVVGSVTVGNIVWHEHAFLEASGLTQCI